MRPVCSGCRMRADSVESSVETGSLLRNEFPGDLTGTGSKRCHKMASCGFCEVLMNDQSGARHSSVKASCAFLWKQERASHFAQHTLD